MDTPYQALSLLFGAAGMLGQVKCLLLGLRFNTTSIAQVFFRTWCGPAALLGGQLHLRPEVRGTHVTQQSSHRHTSIFDIKDKDMTKLRNKVGIGGAKRDACQVCLYACGFPCTPYSSLHGQSLLLQDENARQMYACFRHISKMKPAVS